MQPAGLPAPSLPRNTFLNNGRYRIEREINRKLWPLTGVSWGAQRRVLAASRFRPMGRCL